MRKIEGYRDAERFFYKQPTFKNSTDRVCEKRTKYVVVSTPNGTAGRNAPNGNNPLKRMRMLADKSIQFEYAGEPFCTYHPNGEVTVQAPSQRRWGYFYYQVLPTGIYLCMGPRSGRIACLGGKSNGVSWWDHTRYSLVVRTDKPVRLKLDKDGNWRPVDKKQLTPFKWKAIDRGPARKLAHQKHISGFPAWLRAFRQLQDTEDDGDGGQTASVTELAAAIEQQDYKAVYDGLDRRHTWHYGGPQVGYQHSYRISRLHFEQMRMKVYADGGVLIDKEAATPTTKEWHHIERQLRKFERV